MPLRLCPFCTGSRDHPRRSRYACRGFAPARASSIPARTGACRDSPAAVRWVSPAECLAACPGLRSCASSVLDRRFLQRGKDMERLVAGRERIYLDRFWNDLSKDPKRFDEAKRAHYAALYAQPGEMRAGFAQFLSFGQDAADNKAFLAQGKLQMPVLAFGGE